MRWKEAATAQCRQETKAGNTSWLCSWAAETAAVLSLQGLGDANSTSREAISVSSWEKFTPEEAISSGIPHNG